MRPQDLYASPNALAPHYSRFRVSERLLLTGHSHQAWPDRGFDGQVAAWNDAAELVDAKWERAFGQADRVRAGFARLLGDADGGDYALAVNTHELVTRFLTALPLAERPRLVTTDGEFHSIRRQLDRLDEEGWLEIVRVPAADPETLAERLAAAVDDRTAAVLASAVLFKNARRVPGLGAVAAAARRHGARFLVDVYHVLGAMPFSLREEGLEDAFVVGGGYKYLQLGEGNCFLRTPPGCDLRPVYTGWFAEFEGLERAPDGRVTYGPGPWRFAGSTYDPTSHYRAAAVFDFFAETGLEPPLLREVSQHQVRLLAAEFDALDLDPRVARRDASVDLARVGGFLVLESRRAGDLCGELKRRGVMADYRGDGLRLGPAPYLSDRQLRDAVGVLGEVARAISNRAAMDHPTVIRPPEHAVFNPEKMGKSTLFRSARLLVGLNAFEPGQEHALHAHAGMDKVYHVLAGRGLFLLAGRELPMATGEMLVAPADVPHGIRNTGDERLLVLAVLAPAPGK